MCGISGYIGESKHPAITFKLATRLFERLDARGIDASGYYGCEGSLVHYHKQPLRSAAYVRTESWRKLHDKNCQMLISHARGASQGPPQDNRNNHPFLNQDQTLALIHNGTITEAEYSTLRQKYEVESACDSEILMRIILAADAVKAKDQFPNETAAVATRLMGMKEVFSVINHGHMAAAVAENTFEEKRLWLFRNAYRPLWVADTRDSLGQVWFCSTPAIWSSSVNATPELRRVPGFSKHKLYELTPNDVWLFSLAGENVHYRRFTISPIVSRPKVSSEYANAMALVRATLDDIDANYAKVQSDNSLTPQGYAEFVTRLYNVQHDLESVRRDLESNER